MSPFRWGLFGLIVLYLVLFVFEPVFGPVWDVGREAGLTAFLSSALPVFVDDALVLEALAAASVLRFEEPVTSCAEVFCMHFGFGLFFRAFRASSVATCPDFSPPILSYLQWVLHVCCTLLY